MNDSYEEGMLDAEDCLTPFMESEYSGDYESYILGYNEAHSMLDWENDDNCGDDQYDDEYDMSDADSYDNYDDFSERY